MAEKTTIPLPLPTLDYQQQDQFLLRRTIEQGIQDIHQEIGASKKMQNPISSKAMRRHQFLLMGVTGG
tara:strand:+ start:30 stop:233 length:204 start_codon:yes stop_codon:yes gene_type:complete